MHISYPPTLPIFDHKDEIRSTLENNQVMVIAGDTGSGKTTQLPKICIEARCGIKGRIGCTQPRRIAAVSVAERVAEETQSDDEVGYKIRFQDRVTENTIVKFMTDGVLLAESRSDRLLKQYDTLIIDEAHERSLNIDFLLGYIKQLLPKRPDLKVIISSATIDTEKFSKHFSNAPVVSVSGRLFPITTMYQEDENDDSLLDGTYVEQALRVIHDLATDPFGGDILVFMPTERDIFDTIDGLDEYIRESNLILPLFGRLQAADQRKIFKASSKRKIIIATNVAETSITVPGIRFVVDTGLARISRYNVRTGTTSLRISKISQASCNQRQGRCGRTGPGTCIRLYTEQDYLSRDMFTLPEIQRSNLAEVILQMVNLKLGKPEHFPFLDAPLPRAIRKGFQTLIELGALTREHSLTKDGRLMATLPLDPCISKIIIEGGKRDALKETTIIAAALSVQDPRVRPLEKEQKADEAHRQFTDKRSDFLTLLNIWNELFQQENKISWSKLSKFCKANYLSWQRMREWIDVFEQLSRLLKQRTDFRTLDEPASYEAIHMALTSGFLRNICRKKEKKLYLSSGNKEICLFPGSALYKSGGEYIVAAHFIETTQLFARTAANIKAEWLEELGGELCKHSWTNPRWEKKTGRVVADEHVSLFGLSVISGRKVNYGRINSVTRQEAKDIFIREALISNRLGRGYPFLEANQQLICRYREIEERIRRRNVVADEEHLFHFYDRQLGNVYDRFTLNRLLRRKKKDTFLRMTSDDIVIDAPVEDELYQYPPTLQIGELTFALQYLFVPGDEQDGVTVSIPYQIVDHINPAIFEWLVPGLLPEKLLFLLKRLPKRLRKTLVPLPDAVDRIMDSLELYKGSLYQNIEKILLKSYRLKIERTDWQPDALPLFLKMRFSFIDEHGKKCLSSRSFKEIHHYQEADVATSSASKVATDLPEVSNLTGRDLDNILPKISVKEGAAAIVQVYSPCMEIDSIKDQVHLKYGKESAHNRVNNRAGLEVLYSQQFPQEIKQLKKECKTLVSSNSASWLSLGGKVSGAKLRERLFSHVMSGLFNISESEIPTSAYFSDNIDKIRKQGLLRTAAPITKLFVGSLQKRKQAKQKISEWSQRARKSKSFDHKLYDQYMQTLEQVLPHDFLFLGNFQLSLHTSRYLQALIVRVERAEHSPEKDRKKSERLLKSLNRLEQYKEFSSPSTICLQCLAVYKELVEEFRVSVFAPELGTIMPVSEKRLLAYWREVENNCRTVE